LSRSRADTFIELELVEDVEVELVVGNSIRKMSYILPYDSGPL